MVIDLLVFSAIIVGVTEAVKRAFGIPKNFIPLTSIALAIFLGGTAAFFGLISINFLEAIIIGLAASGLWDFGKPPIKSLWKKATENPLKEA